MKLEEEYLNELNSVRQNGELLSEFSIDSSIDGNKNQIKRARILIALYNDLSSNDYPIVDFIFNEEKKLRKDIDSDIVDYEVDVLYLAADLLVRFDKVEDFWKFLDSKMVDFDSSIGFDTQYLLSFGVQRTIAYLNSSDHSQKQIALDTIGAYGETTKYYSEEDIDDWKNYRCNYFSVFKFPVEDEVDFSFQAKEYEYLKNILPDWMSKVERWTEDQHLTAMAIGRDLQMDQLRIMALKSYNEKFPNSVRIKMNQKEIEEIEGETSNVIVSNSKPAGSIAKLWNKWKG